MYLQHIDRHLEGEAAHWVLNTPSVRALIYKGYMELATESDIVAFHGALTQRFKLSAEDCRELATSPEIHAHCLEQGPSEPIEEYYGRARGVLLALHGLDGDDDALMPLERSMRAIVVVRFVFGLHDPSLRYRLRQQQICHPTRTLYKAYKMAEAELEMMKLEKKTQECVEKELERKRKLAEDVADAGNVRRQIHAVVVKIEATDPNI